jgi:hypothetical protein
LLGDSDYSTMRIPQLEIMNRCQRHIIDS